MTLTPNQKAALLEALMWASFEHDDNVNMKELGPLCLELLNDVPPEVTKWHFRDHFANRVTKALTSSA